ncbi:MAG: acetylxylan esterase [Acidobacteriota bacterium]
MLALRSKLLPLCLLLASPVAAIVHAQDSSDGWRAAISTVFYTNHPDPPLHAKVWSTFSPTAGVVAERITYSTDAGMLVTAILYRPDSKVLKAAHVTGKLPAIVVVNGHGSDKFGWYAFYSGMMFAKAGAVVLTYDPIGEGERNAQRLSAQSPSPHDADVAPPAPLPHDDWGRRVAGLMQIDLDQALRYIASRPEVDTKRIGVTGYSLGSFVAGVAGARLVDFNPNYPGVAHFHALLLSGGGVFDNETGYFDKNKSLCQRAPYVTLKQAQYLGDHRGDDLFLLNAMRGPTFIMNGAGDGVMGIPDRDPAWFNQQRAKLLKDCGAAGKNACANVFTSILYGKEVGHRPSWVNRDGVHWLNAQLHFPLWNTDAKIDAQGTTHVSEWITANHVAISPNYFPEQREGGLNAVGTGFPGISRADLSVLPDADWQRLKDQLTYEAWAAKTMATEKQAAAEVH